MANLTTNEKQLLENIFQMGGGYVLNFSDRTMKEFFRDDLEIDIYSEQYNYGSGSKANFMRGFWRNADDNAVGNAILKLIEYIEGQILIDRLSRSYFPADRIKAVRDIADKLLGNTGKSGNPSKATFENGNINITLQKEVFDHVQKLLNDGHHFTAVEESYKIVRGKLKEITGKERAHEAFASSNYERIFGHQPILMMQSEIFLRE